MRIREGCREGGGGGEGANHKIVLSKLSRKKINKKNTGTPSALLFFRSLRKKLATKVY
jgi:hypothetical protein